MSEQKLWSQNALAVEFRLDRRTVAKRLRGVPPAGKIKGGFDGYRLADAAEALLGGHAGGGGHDGDFAAIGAPLTVSQAPVDEGAALALLMMAAQAPAHAASALVCNGVPEAEAKRLFGPVAYSLIVAVESIAEELGLEWRSEDRYQHPLEPDWAAVAAISAEVDAEMADQR